MRWRAIDGKGSIEADGYRPIEQEAPGIVDRKSVSVPMETGILSIDSMVSDRKRAKRADHRRQTDRGKRRSLLIRF